MDANTKKTMFSNQTDEWETPLQFFNLLETKFGKFTLDPCATATNAKCAIFFDQSQDGLTKDWSGNNVFVNPPYSDNKNWIRKCFEEGNKLDTQVVLLCPARTDTAYFHDFIMKASEIYFVRGRLKFGSGKNSAPFPSMVVVFNNKRQPGTLVPKMGTLSRE
jgi:phage N-6-adenine-methyltransferase